jgi:hypothetical protein
MKTVGETLPVLSSSATRLVERTGHVKALGVWVYKHVSQLSFCGSTHYLCANFRTKIGQLKTRCSTDCLTLKIVVFMNICAKSRSALEGTTQFRICVAGWNYHYHFGSWAGSRP